MKQYDVYDRSDANAIRHIRIEARRVKIQNDQAGNPESERLVDRQRVVPILLWSECLFFLDVAHQVL